MDRARCPDADRLAPGILRGNPAEADAGKGKVGRLLRSMYGCRDAGVNWEFTICEVMIAFGFVQGRASSCIYRHLEKQLFVWVHGDDFCTTRLHRQCQGSS